MTNGVPLVEAAAAGALAGPSTSFVAGPASAHGNGNGRAAKRPRGDSGGTRHVVHTFDSDYKSVPDEEVARRLGFPTDKLSEEEAAFLPPDVAVETYCHVRNHVLNTWAQNPTQVLTRRVAAAKVNTAFLGFVDLACSFLTVFGHINFGMPRGYQAFTHRQNTLATSGENPQSPQSHASNGEGQDPSSGPPEPEKGYHTVLVIGAGLSGLAAARHLAFLGHKVLVLEGRDRAGGRVHTVHLEGEVPVDMGGSVLYGGHSSPLATLANQLNMKRYVMTSDLDLYDPQGDKIDDNLDGEAFKLFTLMDKKTQEMAHNMGELGEALSFGKTFNRLWNMLPRADQLLGNPEKSRQDELIHWHIAHMEFSHAQDFNELSAKHCEQDTNEKMYLVGEHTLVRGGNSQLVEKLKEDIPVLYNHKVVRVEYTDRGVTVFAEKRTADKSKSVVTMRTFKAQACVVTLPIGVLKKGVVEFDPPLPDWKSKAIADIGFGTINKCALLFDHKFWDDSMDKFGYVNSDPEERGLHFLIHSYQHVAGGAPVLLALSSGSAAKRKDSDTPESIKAQLMDRLRKIFAKKNIEVPDPIDCKVTNWGNDEFSYGSYSNIVVGASGEVYNRLAEPLMKRVFFAGEGTTRQYLASMHGAVFSGLRVAGTIHTLHCKSTESRLRLLERNAVL